MASKFYSEYSDWIAKNPVEAADYEAIFKWGSLLLAGRTQTPVLPELLYATSNLITLHNDTIILRKSNLLKNGSKIKVWLSVLEYCEVFLELGASRFGTTKKWLLVCLIQVVKCAARFYLLHFKKNGLLSNPPLQPVDRFSFRDKELSLSNPNSSSNMASVIREIPRRRRAKKCDTALTEKRYLAELIFITKPVAHLSTRLLLGESSWKPYILSAAMDSLSLYLHAVDSKENKLRSEDVIVLSQRYFRLLLYFLRSPFYERHFKAVMVSAFNKIFDNVPLTQTILKPLLLYLLKVETVQLEIYWCCGALLVLVVILFILVITLFVKHVRLKEELTRKVKEVHKFNVPYIDPQEDLNKRGYAQYPQRSIALQH